MMLDGVKNCHALFFGNVIKVHNGVKIHKPKIILSISRIYNNI